MTDFHCLKLLLLSIKFQNDPRGYHHIIFSSLAVCQHFLLNQNQTTTIHNNKRHMILRAKPILTMVVMKNI